MADVGDFATNVLDPIDAFLDFSEDDNFTIGFHLYGFTIVGILMPATLTSASIGAQVSFDEGVSWKVVNDTAGTPFVMAKATFDLNQFHAVDPDTFRGADLIRITTSGNELQDDTFKLVVAPS